MTYLGLLLAAIAALASVRDMPWDDRKKRPTAWGAAIVLTTLVGLAIAFVTTRESERDADEAKKKAADQTKEIGRLHRVLARTVVPLSSGSADDDFFIVPAMSLLHISESPCDALIHWAPWRGDASLELVMYQGASALFSLEDGISYFGVATIAKGETKNVRVTFDLHREETYRDFLVAVEIQCAADVTAADTVAEQCFQDNEGEAARQCARKARARRSNAEAQVAVEGRMPEGDGQCVLGSAFGYSDCASNGLCHWVDEACTAQDDVDCRASVLCQVEGTCHAKDGRCVIGTDEDCAHTLGCEYDGKCRVRNGECVKGGERIARRSVGVAAEKEAAACLP